jgi:hypothetical protein
LDQNRKRVELESASITSAGRKIHIKGANQDQFFTNKKKLTPTLASVPARCAAARWIFRPRRPCRELEDLMTHPLFYFTTPTDLYSPLSSTPKPEESTSLPPTDSADPRYSRTAQVISPHRSGCIGRNVGEFWPPERPEPPGHTCLACISLPGELTIIRFFSLDNGILYFCTKLVATNECDAPESNNTIALLSLTRIIPMMTSGAA